MTAVPYLALIASVLALLLAYYFAKVVLRADQGTDLMREIGAAIREGAMAFLRREYRWVSVFVAAMFVLLLIVPIDGRPAASFAYLMGAVLSSVAGFIGMRIATAANTRTANAARQGAAKALPLAFKGGAVMGFSVAGLALLGISINYLLWVKWIGVDQAFQVVAAFGLGASSIALFARIGGGIYTKAADVGGDLVGKVEAVIPEDDPRNPATIADNVGDNVGDVAGMGADLFESYSGSIIAPIALTAFSFAVAGSEATGDDIGLAQLMFPLAVAFVGMLAAIVGSFAVRGSARADVKSLSRQLHMGTNVAMGLTVIGTILVGLWFFSGDEFESWWGLPISVIGGLAVGWAIGKVAEIWTSDHYAPVKKIAQQSETGPATTVLSGISAGMVSVAASVILIGAGVLVPTGADSKRWETTLEPASTA